VKHHAIFTEVKGKSFLKLYIICYTKHFSNKLQKPFDRKILWYA